MSLGPKEQAMQAGAHREIDRLRTKYAEWLPAELKIDADWATFEGYASIATTGTGGDGGIVAQMIRDALDILATVAARHRKQGRDAKAEISAQLSEIAVRTAPVAALTLVWQGTKLVASVPNAKEGRRARGDAELIEWKKTIENRFEG